MALAAISCGSSSVPTHAVGTPPVPTLALSATLAPSEAASPSPTSTPTTPASPSPEPAHSIAFEGRAEPGTLPGPFGQGLVYAFRLQGFAGPLQQPLVISPPVDSSSNGVVTEFHRDKDLIYIPFPMAAAAGIYELSVHGASGKVASVAFQHEGPAGATEPTVGAGPDSTTPVPSAAGLTPDPPGSPTPEPVASTPEATLARTPDAIPGQVAGALARLSMPPGLSMYIDPTGCTTTGRCSGPQFNSGVYYAGDFEIILKTEPNNSTSSVTGVVSLATVAHEMCHAHQDWVSIQEGTNIPSYSLEGWVNTSEGKAFIEATGWRLQGGAWVKTGNGIQGQPDPIEDYAQTCAVWYMVGEGGLNSLYPVAIDFAKAWLP